jgi:hypothetical protein
MLVSGDQDSNTIDFCLGNLLSLLSTAILYSCCSGNDERRSNRCNGQSRNCDGHKALDQG